MKQRIRIVNGIFNYFLAIVLIIAPWFLTPEEPLAAKLSLLIAGLLSGIIGLVSNYELGIIKAIKYKENLMANMILGTLLMSSPLLFGYYEFIYKPQLFLGLFLILLPYTAYKIHFVKKRNLQAQYR
jgi:hypothetical protein